MKRSRSPSLSMSRKAAPVEPAVGSLGVGRGGDVVEVALAVVAEEIAAADGRDVEVGVAVVVVVADGHALAVKRLVEPGLLGHVFESGPCRRCGRGPGWAPACDSWPGQYDELTKNRSWSPSRS